MRCAVLVALGDPRSSDAATWFDAVAWLRPELAELGFHVSVIDGEEVERDLFSALESVTPRDDVFVHISGRLADRGVMTTAGERRVRLQPLADAIAAQAGPNVSFFAELIHKGSADDVRVATEHVAAIVADVGAQARGHALVAAVRPASASIEGLALTRLFLDFARTSPQQGGIVSSLVYEHVASSPEGRACAQHMTFVRGASEHPLPSFDLDPLSSSASEPLPSFASEPLPSFASEPLPSFASEPLPSFASEPLPSFASEPLPSFASEPLASFPSGPMPSFDPEPLPSFEPSASDPSPVRPIDAPIAEAPASTSELGADDIVDDSGEPSSVHARAFAAHWREGRTDSAFLAALALEELGAADVDQQILVDQFRSVAPIRARGTLDAMGWDLLRGVGSRGAVAALFDAVARAAVEARIEELGARKALMVLDPSKRLDEKSTASIVRSFQWAARVLGVPCPALYVIDEVPGDIAAVCAPEPTTALGPATLSGLSAKELAFLAGRHLTYYRPAHQVLVYYPTGEELTRLLLATVEIGAPGTLPAGDHDEISALGEHLKRHLTATELTAIAAASGRLDTKVDLGGWARGIELTAGRAGLLLCGDLAAAARLVRSESRAIGGLTADDRRHDLISFVASPEHGELRARYVASVPSSTPPPAQSPRHPSGVDLAAMASELRSG